MRSLLTVLFIYLTTLLDAQTAMNPQKVYALRLHPGDDIKIKIADFVKEKKIHAGYIITCVGSLKQATIRLSNRNETQTWKETFEITSLTGTLSQDGNHLHISIADKDGKTIGGHLMDGSIIYTTAEIVIGEVPDLIFTPGAGLCHHVKRTKNISSQVIWRTPYCPMIVIFLFVSGFALPGIKQR